MQQIVGMVIARVALTIINIIIKKRHHNNKHYDLKMIHGFNQSKNILKIIQCYIQKTTNKLYKYIKNQNKTNMQYNIL